MNKQISILLLLLAVGLMAGELAAQVAQNRDRPSADSPRSSGQSPERGLRIFLLTMAPGEPLYARWGHTALHIYDTQRGRSIVFDYGLFHFDRWFIFRYLKQEPSFMLGTSLLERNLERYRRQGRGIYSQELLLEAASANRLARKLHINLRPENRRYSYHNYLDNCTTRIRDLASEALGNRLHRHFKGRPANTSFRRASTSYLLSTPLYWYFLNLLVGSAIDAPISSWEWMFLPDTLMRSLEEYRQAHPESGIGPIKEIVKAKTAPSPNLPLRWTFFVVCYLLLVILLFAAPLVMPLLRRHSPLSDFASRLGWYLWNSFAGLLGTVIAFLWLIVGWDYCQNNLNILAFSPFALLLLPCGWMLHKARYTRINLYIHAALLLPPLLGTILALIGLQQDSLPYMLPSLAIQALILARIWVTRP